MTTIRQTEARLALMGLLVFAKFDDPQAATRFISTLNTAIDQMPKDRPPVVRTKMLGPIRSKVIAQLARGPQTAFDIAAAIYESINDVEKVLNDFCDEGAVIYRDDFNAAMKESVRKWEWLNLKPSDRGAS